MIDNFDIFFNKKPSMLMVALLNNTGIKYSSLLSKEIDCTYCHVTNLLIKLSDMGIITIKEDGRKNIITLTPAGIEIAKSIITIQECMMKLKGNIKKEGSK